ncbi:hypothetical protein BASA50_011040 [Batrachochytrium salamandrivorans]|uniref:Uncharacterized protein n=1 Tax=Batrachochytrium salamandrivorans TaxID=1357716 RepID=A0ABQ8EZK4_9FUNG|nr:hypothetical protein BASA61_008842 [Batrachochytrium salamandrivorans]KAH6587849.1 hypothetical protein BASA50_011040 [Batrachochytrium salamandrivorans]
MKLTLFAMISFMAVTASASVIPANSDYSASRLEKRMVEESYEEADEDFKMLKRISKHNENARKTVAERHKKQREMAQVLNEGAGTSKDELKQNTVSDSEEQDLEGQLGAASMEDSHQQKQMQDAEMEHSLKMAEKEMLHETQHQLKEHNVNHPDDPLGVEPGSVYNKDTLEEQVNEFCEREGDVLDDMAEKASDGENSPTSSDTDLFNESLKSAGRDRAAKRECLNRSRLYKGL